MNRIEINEQVFRKLILKVYFSCTKRYAFEKTVYFLLNKRNELIARRELLKVIESYLKDAGSGFYDILKYDILHMLLSLEIIKKEKYQNKDWYYIVNI